MGGADVGALGADRGGVVVQPATASFDAAGRRPPHASSSRTLATSIPREEAAPPVGLLPLAFHLAYASQRVDMLGFHLGRCIILHVTPPSPDSIQRGPTKSNSRRGCILASTL